MDKTPMIAWNDAIRLVLSDVDETIAEVYTPADPLMIDELTKLLQEGRKLFMVTGGSLQRVKRDIIDFIPAKLRHDILVSHCSGAEVWGFQANGEVKGNPFYSIYEETFSDNMKRGWRMVTDQLLAEFKLRPHPVQPKINFWGTIGHDPLDMMLDDRGPQITFEIVNGIDLNGDQLDKLGCTVPLTRGKYDLRIAIMERAIELFAASQIPVSPRLGGVFAIDFALKGVSKTTSIQKVLYDAEVLATIGLGKDVLDNPNEIEVWGDKFSFVNGGTDRFMSEAVDPHVRSIDFRNEDPNEFPKGGNIVLWNGKYHLHHGLLEYLQSRHKQ